MSFTRLPVLRHGLMLRHENILSDSAMQQRIQEVRQLMRARKVTTLMACSDAARSGPVCYLTDYPCFDPGRRAAAVLSLEEGPFLFTAEPSRNLPRVRRFTACDVEGTRRFLHEACERAKRLSGAGPIGRVGFDNLPGDLLKETEKLAGSEREDLSPDFAALLAAKDDSSLQATRRALQDAQEGMALLGRELGAGKSLWQVAAEVDYRLRLLGCEDTNILLGCATGGRVRPGYPPHLCPQRGEIVAAYVAVQYARHWAGVGRTFVVESASNDLQGKIRTLEEVRRILAAQVKAGMTLQEVKNSILESGAKAGVLLEPDVPLAAGIGFDLLEYPMKGEDCVPKNTVLQIALAAQVDAVSAMHVDLLHVTGGESCVWLSGTE